MSQHLLICIILCIFIHLGTAAPHKIEKFPFLYQNDVLKEEPPFSAYSGYLKVKDRGKGEDRRRLFYWFVESETNPDERPLVLYSNGGPGCATSIAFFEGPGPVRIVNETKVVLSEYPWNKAFNILFIDHPAGAGLSRITGQRGRDDSSAMPSGTKEAMMDLASALNDFVETFPKFKNRDFFLSGESYAGRYMPMLLHLYDTGVVSFPLHVKGIFLGNAAIYSSIQVGSIPDHAAAFGISSYAETVQLNSLVELCRRDILNNYFEATHDKSCWPLMKQVLVKSGNLNAYDVRLPQDALDEHKKLSKYLVHVNFQKRGPELGIEKFEYESKTEYYNFHRCASALMRQFYDEIYQDTPDEVLHTLLNKQKYNVLLYSGQFDLRVDSLGTAEFLRLYPWLKRELFNAQKLIVFKENEHAPASGHFQYVDKVAMMSLYGASHMTGELVPGPTYEMARRFVEHGTLCPTKADCHKMDEPDSLPTCANGCSGHGECRTDFTCRCTDGYTDADCSVLNTQFNEDPSTSYSGTIVGNEAIIYRFEIVPSTAIVNLELDLNRTSVSGAPYVFVNVSTPDITPDGRTQKHILRIKMEHNRFGGYSTDSGFQYFNNSRNPDKTLRLKNIPVTLGAKNILSVGVYNAEHSTTHYNFSVKVIPTSMGIHMFWFFFALAVIFIAIIVAEMWIISSRLKLRSRLTKAHKYQRLIPQSEGTQLKEYQMDLMNQFDSDGFSEDEPAQYL